MNQNWSNQTVENVAQHFSVDLGLGLTDKQVEENTHKFGFNELKEKEKETLLTKIINQLKDLMIIILMIASAVSAAVGEVADALVIVAIVVIMFAGIPFMVYLMASEELSPAFHDFYTDHLVIGAAIVIALVFVELLLMGIQAHRAHFTEVDRVVRGATHTEA